MFKFEIDYAFQTVAERVRSRFTPRKPRTFQHRTRLLIEHLEDRLTPSSLVTDHSIYVADQTAVIVGKDFVPNESVALRVIQSDDAASAAEPTSWSIEADEYGAFQTTYLISADQASGAIFDLSAAGSQGDSASTAFSIAIPLSSPVLTTDLSDYSPGATAVIHGGGFGPSETVTLQVFHSGTMELAAGDNPWQVTAGADGSFTTTWYVDPAYSFGASFIVTATGSEGNSASTTFSDSAASLTTTFASNNSQNGNMFDISVLHSVQITGFDVNQLSTTASWAIYSKVGTWVGSENNLSAWTLIASASNVTTNGPNVPTHLPVTLNVTIPAGQTYGFYLTITSGTTTGYTNGTAVGNVAAADANIQIREGAGKVFPFSDTFTPRIWNGTVYYDTTTLSTATTVTSSTNPSVYGQSMSFTATVTNGNGGTPTGTVQFQIGGSNFGSPVTLSGSGSATSPSISTLAAGNSTVTALYSGSAGNYASSSGSLTQTVNTAPSTTTVTGGTFTYDGSGHGAVSSSVTGAGGLNTTASSFSYVGTGSTTYGPTSAAPTNAGTYTVTATYNGDANHNSSTSSAAGTTINKAFSTTIVTGGTFTYDGNGHGVASSSVTGAGGLNTTASSFSFVGTGSTIYGPTSTAPTNAGTYTVTATYNGDANHNSSTSSAAGTTINKAFSTTIVTGGTFTYDGNGHGAASSSVTGAGGLNTTASSFSYVGTGSTIYGPTSTAPTNAGTYTVTATYNGDVNHNSSSGSASVTVNKAHLTVTADAKAKTYGDVNPVFTVTLSGFQIGETDSVVSGSPTFSTTAGQFSNVGTYTITVTSAGTLAATNYDFPSSNFVSGTLTIGQKSATVTANNKSKTYGDANPTLDATVSGTVNGDVLGYSLATDASQFSNVGGYGIVVSLGTNANYDITPTDGTLTIGQKSATVTANNKSKTYGDVNPTLDATVNGTVNGDVLGYWLATDASQFSNVGGYGIVVTLGSNANYDLTLKNGALTVTPFAFSYQIGNDSHVYGSTDDFATLATTISTGVNGENLAIAYSSVGNTVTAHVGSSSPITGTVSNGTGLTTDYDLTLKNGALTMTPFAFSYQIGNDSHVYGSTDDFATLATTISTGVNGENLAIAYSSVGNTVTAHVGSSSPITGTVSNGTGLTTDYDLTLKNGALTVTPFAFSYQIGNDSHVYGSTDDFATLATTISTGVNGENLGIAYSSVGNTVTAHVGSSSPITGTVSNGTGLTTDYNLTLKNCALTVTPFAFSYQIGNDSHVYGGTDSFSTLATTISTGVNGENLAIAYSSVGNTVTAHVGSSSPITGTVSNGTGLTTDYDLTLKNGALTVTPFAFSYQIGNDSHVYGSTDDFATLATTISTGVNGENLAIAYSSVGNTVTAHVGSSSPITGTVSNGTGLTTDYDLTLKNGALMVTPFAFSYQIGSFSKTYGDTASLATTLGTTINTGVNSENLDIAYTSAGTSATTHVVGSSYDVTGTLSDGSGKLSDYNVTLKNGALTVTARPITVTADAKTKIFGTANPALTYQITIGNLVNGDTLSGSLIRDPGESVGTYAIRQGTLSASSDYNLTYVGANLTITAGAPVKIEGGGALSASIHFGFEVHPKKDDSSTDGFKGHLEFEDKGGTGTGDDLKFKSTSITFESASDSHHGVFTGTGSLNDVSGYTFKVTVEDNAKKGAGNDKFGIQIYNATNTLAYDSSTHAGTNTAGILTTGDVKIHYDKDDFSTSTLQGAGSFMSDANGAFDFNIFVQTDGSGGYTGTVQFTQGTDPNYTYTLDSTSITTMKVGGIVTVTGTCMINGVDGYKFQVDWETGKHSLHLRTFDSAGHQLLDSHPNPLTTGSVTFTASLLLAGNGDDSSAPYAGTLIGASGQVLTGTEYVTVVDDDGTGIDATEVDRITDAMAYLDGVFANYGFTLVWADADHEANTFIHIGSTTPMGGKSDGVLGLTSENSVWLVSAWNFYSGADTAAIGADQFDFQTVATHEMGHVLGLGHSADSSSVMYAYLGAGTARRSFSDGDLSLINSGGNGGLMTAEGGFLHVSGQPYAADPDGGTDALTVAGGTHMSVGVPVAPVATFKTTVQQPTSPGVLVTPVATSITTVPQDSSPGTIPVGQAGQTRHGRRGQQAVPVHQAALHAGRAIKVNAGRHGQPLDSSSVHDLALEHVLAQTEGHRLGQPRA